MELVPSLPTELIGLAERFDRLAPDLSRSVPGQADPSAAPFSFGELLQLIETLPLIGEPLPQAGKDLPVATDLSGSSPAALPMPTISFVTGNPLAATASSDQPSSMAQARGAEPLTQSVADLLWSRLQAAGAGSTYGASTNAGIRTAEAAVSSDAPHSTDVAPAVARYHESTAPAAPVARDLVQNQSSAEAVSRAGAPIGSYLQSQVTEDAGAARARSRSNDRASARAVAAVEPQRLESTASSARHGSVPLFVADAAAEPTSATRGSQLGAGTLGAAPFAGGEVAAPHGNALGGTLAPTLGATPAAHSVGTTAAAGTGETLDTATPRWNEALAGRIQWMIDHDIGKARIKLNPPELGALDVKISLLDDKTYVQLAAANPAARDELTQSLPRLRELLAESGFDLAGATVSDGHEQSSRDAPAEEHGMPVEFAASAHRDAESARFVPRRSTQIDLYA